MTVEAAVSIASGLAAGSLVVTAFGLDSLIELASASVLMWRLSVELRHGRLFSESTERIASRIAGGLLFALAAYLTIAAGWSLLARTGAAFSWPGFIVALAAIRPCAISPVVRSPSLKGSVVEPCERMRWRP